MCVISPAPSSRPRPAPKKRPPPPPPPPPQLCVWAWACHQGRCRAAATAATDSQVCSGTLTSSRSKALIEGEEALHAPDVMHALRCRAASRNCAFFSGSLGTAHADSVLLLIFPQSSKHRCAAYVNPSQTRLCCQHHGLGVGKKGGTAVDPSVLDLSGVVWQLRFDRGLAGHREERIEGRGDDRGGGVALPQLTVEALDIRERRGARVVSLPRLPHHGAPPPAAPCRGQGVHTRSAVSPVRVSGLALRAPTHYVTARRNGYSPHTAPRRWAARRASNPGRSRSRR
jgi:hypothetical protein